jgi:ABC-2 type transport system permease protein
VIARTASSVQGISFLVLFPLTFLSNAFVPVDTLPDWLKWFVNVNPVSHLITAIREIINQGVIGTDFWLSVLGAVVVVAIFAPVTVAAYMRKA